MRSPVTWVIVLGVALAAGAYLLYRRNASASAATTAPAPAGADTAAETGTLQTEIADLQSSQAQEQGQETAEPVTVPRVTGMTQATAEAVLTAAGLRPQGRKAVRGKTLRVTGQSPGPGAKAPRGSAVKLTSQVETPPKKPAGWQVSGKPPITKPGSRPKTAANSTRAVA